jgi:hypothetical protein
MILLAQMAVDDEPNLDGPLFLLYCFNLLVTHSSLRINIPEIDVSHYSCEFIETGLMLPLED